jgi:hypothetical protein
MKLRKPYANYTPMLGFTADELSWSQGRNVGGAAIGVLQFSANIPMMPGNVGNAATALPVFDSITPIKWLHSGVVQRPCYGCI